MPPTMPAPMPEPRPAPRYSAPVSRTTPGGGYTRPGEVTLSPEERQIARASGISDLEYARNKVRLAQEKALGRYNEPS